MYLFSKLYLTLSGVPQVTIWDPATAGVEKIDKAILLGLINSLAESDPTETPPPGRLLSDQTSTSSEGKTEDRNLLNQSLNPS